MNNNLHTFILGKARYGASTLLLLCCILFAQMAEAGLQQVFRDGEAGRFPEARAELQKLSKGLEAELRTADISIGLRNSAALGFYFILSQVASDSVTDNLATQSGMKLFEAGRSAASGELKKAVSLAKAVTTANPDYLPGFFILGRALMLQCMQKSKNCEEAISAFQHSISLDKTFAVSYLDLGMLYQQMGKRQEAIQILNTAISEDKASTSSKWAHLLLAMLYVDSKQWQLAQGHAEKAKDLGLQASNTLLSEIKKHVPKDITTDTPNKPKLGAEGTADKTISTDADRRPGSCGIREGKEEQIGKMMNEISDKGLSALISNIFNLISSIISWIMFSIFCLLGI